MTAGSRAGAPLPTDASIVGILEAAYRPVRTEAEWLEGVAAAMLPAIDRGCGLHAYLINASRPDVFEMIHPIGVGLSPEWAELWRGNWWETFMAPLDAKTAHWLHRFAVCSHAGELWDAGAAAMSSYAEYLATLAANGYGKTHARYLRPDQRPGEQRMFHPDSFNVVSLDATGRGSAFLVNLPEATSGPVDPAMAETWARIAGHLSAGLRLLHDRAHAAGVSEFDHAEAILDPSGKVQHADGPAKSARARESLREAARGVERARGGEEAPGHALDLWQAMTSGRWTVVDRFDHDGRRFFVAHPNNPNPLPDRRLSPRERQVVDHAALGHSNKVIAYELGLGSGTVSTHLSAAARKLGVTTRIELIRRHLEGRALDDRVDPPGRKPRD